jgi:hypothetical protein
MGILVVLSILTVLSILAMAGRTADSRRDTGRFDWATPMNAGRGDPAIS